MDFLISTDGAKTTRNFYEGEGREKKKELPSPTEVLISKVDS